MLAINVFDALDRVFDDTLISKEKMAAKVRLDGFPGGQVSFQLACQGLEHDLRWRIRSFIQGKKSVRFAPRIYRLIFVRVEANTSWDRNLDPPDQRGENPVQPFVDETLDPRMRPHVIKAAPFYTAEALAPFDFSAPEKNRPTVYYISFSIEANVSPGRYAGTVHLAADRESVDIPLEINVGRVRPAATQGLKVTNWFSLDNIADYHHVRKWSADYWSMLRRYARLMKEYGQNVFWVPEEVFIEGKKHLKPAWNWPRFDRYVNLFLKEGFEWIEGTHLAVRKSQKNPGAYVISGTTTEATSLEGQEYLREVTAGLWNHLKLHRWDGKYLQHVADEPTEPEVGDYHRLTNLVRKFMPGVRLMDAILHHRVMGALDVHVPVLFEFDRTYTFANFRELARMGGEFWFYTCCGPRGSYLNRFLDFPLIKTRLLHWVNFREGATGYLHWGLNMYQTGQDPFESSVGQTAGEVPVLLPPGDTHVVYPGPDGPWPSLRLEAMRDGILDYELLRTQASRAGRRRSIEKLARRMVRSPSDYITGIPEFRRLYRKLISAGER